MTALDNLPGPRRAVAADVLVRVHSWDYDPSRVAAVARRAREKRLHARSALTRARLDAVNAAMGAWLRCPPMAVRWAHAQIGGAR